MGGGGGGPGTSPPPVSDPAQSSVRAIGKILLVK